MTTILANEHVLECNMKPIRRFGVDTEIMNVYNTQERMIGYYNPILNEFTLIDDWKIKFSNSLIEKLGIKR